MCTHSCCAEAEVQELQEEFARRLGQADRRIEQLQVWLGSPGRTEARLPLGFGQ